MFLECFAVRVVHCLGLTVPVLTCMPWNILRLRSGLPARLWLTESLLSKGERNVPLGDHLDDCLSFYWEQVPHA
jgi:hypothetical protein